MPMDYKVCLIYFTSCLLMSTGAQEYVTTNLDESKITGHLVVKLGVTSIANTTFAANSSSLQDAASQYYKETETAICDIVKNALSTATATTSLGSVNFQTCSVANFTDNAENTQLLLAFSDGTAPVGTTRTLLDVTTLKGYGLAVTNVTIADVNECTEMSICSPYSICTNSEGGFDCQCELGYDDVALSFQNLLNGRYCSEPCKANSCNSHGTCRVRFDGPVVCACDKDYTSDNCTKFVGVITTPTPPLEDWSIVVIAVSMGALALFLIFTVPFLVYKSREYKLLEEEEEKSFTERSAASYRSAVSRCGTMNSRSQVNSSLGSRSNNSSIAAYQARLPDPSRIGSFSIPRPIVINPRTYTIHDPYSGHT